jgi:hypothetical protein
MRPKFMARSGETDKRVLARLGDSVLGHCWNTTEDIITFTLVVDIATKKDKVKGLNKIITKENLSELKKIKFTKRLVPSIVSGWFNPMGLICPITIKFKIKLSEIIKMKELSWDDSLGEKLTDHWLELIAEIVNLPELKFHRSAKPHGFQGPPEMVIFWDRANLAYGGNIYLRWKVEESQGLQSQYDQRVSSEWDLGTKFPNLSAQDMEMVDDACNEEPDVLATKMSPEKPLDGEAAVNIVQAVDIHMDTAPDDAKGAIAEEKCATKSRVTEYKGLVLVVGLNEEISADGLMDKVPIGGIDANADMEYEAESNTAVAAKKLSEDGVEVIVKEDSRLEEEYIIPVGWKQFLPPAIPDQVGSN